ncbi:MAG: molybdopterin-dependent oxidoreductase [Acidobacteria bacterium]|nr:molybdopterin-dependent oxidoreductase [Acidobacteriota bacterium]
MGSEAKIERREFLRLIAGATTGLAVSGCSGNSPATNGEQAADWPSGVERWITSTCLGCPGGCGIQVRVVDGNAVKIEGNPLHPVNRGKLCPIGQAGLQLLYNPDRIKSPMKRIGGKGSKKWAAISWDEAIQTVASRLRELRERGEPHSLVILDGQPGGLLRALWARLADAYGSPNHIVDEGGDGMTAAHALMQGIDRPFGYDLESSTSLLSFGCALLDGWRSPVRVARSHGFLRQERPGSKAKLIQIDRRFSLTAAKADEWVPIQPGSEGALALGLAYVIIREELYDREFVSAHTFGFDDWTDARGEQHIGFKTLVLRDYRPEVVSEITGIPVDTIIKLAKEFAANRPAIAIGDVGATEHTNGAYNAMAIHSLNALVGSIETRGGVLLEPDLPLKAWPPVSRDAAAENGLAKQRIDGAGTERFPLASNVPPALSGAVLSQSPYPVNALFLYKSNPLFSAPNIQSFRRALATIPLVVSFSSFLDESTEYADLILPDHTYLEKWQDAPAAPISGIPTLGITQPVVEPLYDTMHTGDAILKITQAIGGTVAEAFPWKDFKEALVASTQGLFDAQHGALFSDPFEEAHARALQERGWWVPAADSFEGFWNELVNKGGWWELLHPYGTLGAAFKTPSGKFEFYSQRLKETLETIAQQKGSQGTVEQVLEALRIEARGDLAYLPHYEPPRWQGDEKKYPFHLHHYKPAVLSSEVSANLPWLQELVGPHVHMKWDSWVEINPDAVKELGVADGDWVWVESSQGKLLTRAKLYPGTMPQVVNIPSGLGHTALGRWAKDRGVNPNEILGEDYDRLSGRPAWYGTRVKVYKA